MLDDILHGIAEAARRVHGDQNQRGLAFCGVVDAFIDVSSEDGLYFAIKLQFEDDGTRGVLVSGG